MPFDVEALIAQIHSVYENAPVDQVSRQKLYDAAQDLALKLETPRDTMQRLCYLVSRFHRETVRDQALCNLQNPLM